MRFPFRTDKPLPRITSPFGLRRHPKSGEVKNHNGVDFGAATGTDLFAIADGKVIESKVSTHPTGGFGEYVKIDHGNGVVSLYAHMVPGSRKVKKGDIVSEGDLIGDVGESGYTTGPHLHLEITVNGKYVDPVAYIRKAMNAEKVVKPIERPVIKPLPKVQTYTIKPGDTLGKVAKQFNTTVAELARLNNIQNVNLVRVNQVIKLPTVVEPPKPVEKVEAPKEAPKPVKTAPKASESTSKTYTVVSGDTLTKIARKYKTTVAVLKKINNIQNANLIRVGQVIKLP